MERTRVTRDLGKHGGGVAEPYGSAGADVDDSLRGGERGGVHGAGDVPYVDEVALHPEATELQLAVAGLHGAAHRLGEPAQRGARRGAGADRREDPQYDRVEAGTEDEFGGGELGDAVRPTRARDGVLRRRGAGLRGPVLRGAAHLDEAGAAAAAPHRLADGGDGDGVVPGQVAGAAAGGARAVDDDAGVDGVQEAGECSGGAAREVEPYVGVVAAAERREVHGGVGEQPVGHEPAEEPVGAEQQNPHRVPPSCRRRAAGAGDWGVMSGVSLGRW